MRPRSFRGVARSSSSSRGFTLVEVLVALVLIEIGLLALAASSAVVVRELTLVRVRVTALEMARNRVEALAATPCIAAAGTASGPSEFHEDWLSRIVAGSMREIRDSVTFTVRGVSRTVVFHRRTPCVA